MKCPYCNENTISPFKKVMNTNIKCYSCGKIIHFSVFKRTISVLGFLTAVWFNNILNTQKIYNLIIFFSLIIVLFGVLWVIPREKDE